jgi:hypothetical protein
MAPKTGKAHEAVAIQLPPLKLRTLEITLVGDSPLICHKWSEKAKKEMLDKQMKKAKQKKEAKDPWMQFCESLYWLTPMPERPTSEDIEQAEFGVPTIGFKAAAVNACSHADGVTKVLARGAFHIDGELVKLEGRPTMREDVTRIGMGVADLRYRGEFKNWRVTLRVRYNENVLSAEQIVNLFNIAGFAIGVFEWRPQKNGGFGMFHVATADELENAA